ncbi:MAG: YdiU family protein, partial [Acidimicrobiales bacterium]
MPAAKTLDQLKFDNRFTDQLPADPKSDVIPRQVYGAAFSRVMPKTTSAPSTVAVAAEMLELLELDAEQAGTDQFARVFSGNEVLAGMDPFAMAYAGHQFGNFAGQLGDGRAIALGEVVTSSGDHFMLQLKGAGPTPYSRSADGLAVLRSSIREFLCSEAMHHLGVPTTRALSLVRTGDQVMRDMFYDGHAAFEHGAVVCRVAPTFIRFGNFELFSSRNELDELRTLVEFTIRTEFSDIAAEFSDLASRDAVVALFAEVARRTATMIVHWLRVGFVHGVMNTDNMSILGLTIDYGPYGWLEDFDPGWTPNTTDASHKRYRYGAQSQIAQWNLMRLANALYPLVEEAEPLQDALDEYSETFRVEWQAMMMAKLGLNEWQGDADAQLVNDLLAVLQLTETDMTIFYRKLADVAISEEPDAQRI